MDIAGTPFDELVENHLVTDAFSFFSFSHVQNWEPVQSEKGSGRAQRTFVGSNGEPGDIIVVVSEGRYADGKSVGLTTDQCARLMYELGCKTAVQLDGGGSSTMYFRGQVLNSARGNQRSVRDFLTFI